MNSTAPIAIVTGASTGIGKNISIKLSENKLTTVSVNDLAGRQVDLLVHSVLSKGIYQLSWNGSNQISGIYFIRIKAGNHLTTKKVLLLK